MGKEYAVITRFWFWAIFATFGMVCLTETGCSTKEPKYPEDHARFQRVVQAIKSLENAYVNKDQTAFHELLLPLEQLDNLETEVKQDFAVFDTIQLDFTVDRILIEGDRISAFMSWQGQWQRAATESRDQARGHGVLLWSGHQVILLRGIEGDLPFGMASRLNIAS